VKNSIWVKSLSSPHLLVCQGNLRDFSFNTGIMTFMDRQLIQIFQHTVKVKLQMALGCIQTPSHLIVTTALHIKDQVLQRGIVGRVKKTELLSLQTRSMFITLY
jgi:hypothetical protein